MFYNNVNSFTWDKMCMLPAPGYCSYRLFWNTFSPTSFLTLTPFEVEVHNAADTHVLGLEVHMVVHMVLPHNFADSKKIVWTQKKTVLMNYVLKLSHPSILYSIGTLHIEQMRTM